MGAAGATIQAADGSRPILVGADGYPAGLHVMDGATIRGVWFGGLRPPDNVNRGTITMGKGCLVEDCTLFNYNNGIQNGSDAHGNTYRRNRFIRCGYQNLYHPLYVANLNSSGPADGCLTELCLMVGCEGYSIHYYHQPSYGLAQNNGIFDARDGLALQGDQGGPVSGIHNIIWGVSRSPLYDICTSGSCDKNLWVNALAPSAGGAGTVDDNRFWNTTPFGTNAGNWNQAEVEAALGVAAADINAAVAALEASIDGQTVQHIHDDAAIETSFAVLAGALATWAGQP